MLNLARGHNNNVSSYNRLARAFPYYPKKQSLPIQKSGLVMIMDYLKENPPIEKIYMSLTHKGKKLSQDEQLFVDYLE